MNSVPEKKKVYLDICTLWRVKVPITFWMLFAYSAMVYLFIYLLTFLLFRWYFSSIFCYIVLLWIFSVGRGFFFFHISLFLPSLFLSFRDKFFLCFLLYCSIVNIFSAESCTHMFLMILKMNIYSKTLCNSSEADTKKSKLHFTATKFYFQERSSSIIFFTPSLSHGCAPFFTSTIFTLNVVFRFDVLLHF